MKKNDQKFYLDPDFSTKNFWDKKVMVNQDPTKLKSRVWLSQLSLLPILMYDNDKGGLKDLNIMVKFRQETQKKKRF